MSGRVSDQPESRTVEFVMLTLHRPRHRCPPSPRRRFRSHGVCARRLARTSRSSQRCLRPRDTDAVGEGPLQVPFPHHDRAVCSHIEAFCRRASCFFAARTEALPSKQQSTLRLCRMRPDFSFVARLEQSQAVSRTQGEPQSLGISSLVAW